MKKLENPLRVLVIAALACAFAGPASAGIYTMQDYYNALAAVESDSWQISNLQSDISSTQSLIDSANGYYQWQYNQCGGIRTSWGAPDWYAIYDCQDSIAAEWSMVIDGYYADIAGYEAGLWAMYPILSNDQALLAAIKADLGIE